MAAWSSSATGLRLKHDHRHEDGTPDTNTDYGGETTAGTAARQEFPVDEQSIRAVPARATQHWYIELHAARHFVHGMLRDPSELRYRMWSSTSPVPPPPQHPPGHGTRAPSRESVGPKSQADHMVEDILS
ncbi:MAG: hypothetical protein ACR2H9_01955 [Longimicrobiaceae bacterium]